MWAAFRKDLHRYLDLMPELSTAAKVVELAATQGVWALSVYRFGAWARTLPRPARRPLLAAYLVAAKAVEVATGIYLPASARVGPGLYIGHFGGIVVSPDSVLGAGCNLSHGVTIGTLARGHHEAPVIGDGVYLGAGAKVLGGVHVGDGAVIGANAVVTHDVPAGATAVGVPAVVRPPRVAA